MFKLPAALFLAGTLAAQVVPVPDRKLWFLHTVNSTYVLGVNERNELQTLYWGGRLYSESDFSNARAVPERSSFDPSESRTPEEYPGWGGRRFFEPALKLTRSDGNRDLVLVFASAKQTADTLDIELADIKDPIHVTLSFHVYTDLGIIEKHAVIHNGGKDTLALESAQSGVWSMPAGDGYQLSYVSGDWAAEDQLSREPIHTGVKILESRRGNTSHNANPWFMIDDGHATERNGRVWFGALAWSGNWRMAVEQTPYNQLRVTGGFNSFDFGYSLAPGESLTTPAFYGGYSGAGFGEASRRLHRFERAAILPGGVKARTRPILYNSWEATTFNVDEAGQKALAAKAASLGIEMFVIDDGWFGKRNSDNAGLGDWTVNTQKFPNGFEPLIDEVQRLGMDFGLWVEPEMVNPDSDLYRAHPDWVLNFPGRPRSELRNQLVLNLARTDVREYIYGALDRLATTYKIRYFKWDMNRSMSEPGWPATAVGDQKRVWVDYVHNYYNILDRLRAKHPQLEIESCSGGGARIDLGVLQRVDEVWPSDNTEAFDRLHIQEGFTYAYTPKIMSSWVTDVPNTNGRSTPLRYRFLVAMQGALGIGANLNKWTIEDLSLAKKMVAIDKTIRETVQTGALYRLLSPRDSDVVASEYIAEDGRQTVVFAFRHSQEFNLSAPAIHLEALEARATYAISDGEGGHNETHTGAYLMQHGLDVNLRGDYDSALRVLVRQ